MAKCVCHPKMLYLRTILQQVQPFTCLFWDASSPHLFTELKVVFLTRVKDTQKQSPVLLLGWPATTKV